MARVEIHYQEALGKGCATKQLAEPNSTVGYSCGPGTENANGVSAILGRSGLQRDLLLIESSGFVSTNPTLSIHQPAPLISTEHVQGIAPTPPLPKENSYSGEAWAGSAQMIGVNFCTIPKKDQTKAQEGLLVGRHQAGIWMAQCTRPRAGPL